MKIVKAILMVIGILVGIVLIAALFMKKEYTVMREIVINKPRAEVFNYIKFLKNQEHYNKWTMMDPNSKKDYKGTDGSVGFVLSWDSQNKDVGQGEQEITKIAEGERINIDLRFIRPFKGEAKTHMETEQAGDNQTKVKWVFEGKSPYPMNIMIPAMDNMLGKDLATSIANLKAELEK
jgi:uncharacterized protein YndB with AHSA1/START domain